jgi:hypothetical protein
VRAALVAVVLVLALPGAALAQSFSVPAQLPEPVSPELPHAGGEGPALAGDRVLWFERRAGADVLVAARAGEAPRAVLTLAPRPGTARRSLAADGTTALVQRIVAGVTERLRIDLATGAVTPFDACLGDMACARCRSDPLAIEITGSVLAETGACLPGGAVIDLADGSSRRFDKPVLTAAGPYALVDAGPFRFAELRLVDWRTGAPVRSVEENLNDEETGSAPRAERQVAVGPDGTIAWVRSNLFVLPPGAREPREISLYVKGLENELVEQVRLAGGLVATRKVAFPTAAAQAFQVSAPDGSGVRRVDGQYSHGGWAFDGRRLAWATRPCAQTVIQVWDLSGAPPAKAPERCVTASVVRRAVRIRDTHALPVTLRCPATQPQGCDGVADAGLYTPDGRRELTYTAVFPYTLPAGTTRTVHLRILHRARRRGRRRLVADAEFVNPHRGMETKHARFAVRVG